LVLTWGGLARGQLLLVSTPIRASRNELIPLLFLCFLQTSVTGSTLTGLVSVASLANHKPTSFHLLYRTYLAMKDTYGSSSFVPEWLMLAVPAAFVGSAVLVKGLILAHLWPLTAENAIPPDKQFRKRRTLMNQQPLLRLKTLKLLKSDEVIAYNFSFYV
jgi:hypothetical protein